MSDEKNTETQKVDVSKYTKKAEQSEQKLTAKQTEIDELKSQLDNMTSEKEAQATSLSEEQVKNLKTKWTSEYEKSFEKKLNDTLKKQSDELQTKFDLREHARNNNLNSEQTDMVLNTLYKDEVKDIEEAKEKISELAKNFNVDVSKENVASGDVPAVDAVQSTDTTDKKGKTIGDFAKNSSVSVVAFGTN